MDYNTIYSVRATPKNMDNSTTYPTVVSPHLDGQNRAYVDGHVKWQPLAKFIHLSSETSSHCDNTTTTVATYQKGVSDTYCDPSFNPWMN